MNVKGDDTEEDVEGRVKIVKAWHRFDALEQFEYLDDLNEFAKGGRQSQTWSGELGAAP